MSSKKRRITLADKRQVNQPVCLHSSRRGKGFS